jgi:hypothetical protein
MSTGSEVTTQNSRPDRHHHGEGKENKTPNPGKQEKADKLARRHKERARHNIDPASANAVVEKMKKTVASARQGQD